LVVAKKELQQVRKDNQVLAHYINAKRRKEVAQKEKETQKKAEEEARKKVKEGQSSKYVRT
jgi:hypothetical protein